MHPIENILQTTMAEIKSLVDVSNVVGTPIEAGETTVIPISKVSVGLVSGGGEYGNKKDDSYPFTGGSGTGVSIHPVGFLVVGREIKVIPASSGESVASLFELLPQVISDIKRAVKK